MATPSPRTYLLPLPDFAAKPDLKERSVSQVERLKWVKTAAFRNCYELRSRQLTHATLVIRGFFRPSGQAEGIDGSWEMEPLNRESGQIVIRSGESFQEAGIFDMTISSGGGILRTMDGQAFVFRSNFWKGEAEFQAPSGEPLIRYRYRGLFRQSADVEILGKAQSLRELPWILMLGWCLIVAYL